MAKRQAAFNLLTMIAVTKAVEVGERSTFVSEIAKSLDSFALLLRHGRNYVGVVKHKFIHRFGYYKLLL